MKTNNNRDYLCTIGVKIATARRSRAEKITSVALAVGLSHSVISQIENGRYLSLKIDTLIRLSEYLNIPISELFNENLLSNL